MLKIEFSTFLIVSRKAGDRMWPSHELDSTFLNDSHNWPCLHVRNKYIQITYSPKVTLIYSECYIQYLVHDYDQKRLLHRN